MTERGHDPRNAYSMPHLSPYYPEGPYAHPDVTAILGTYEVDRDLARELLPTPLSPGRSPKCLLWFFDNEEVDGLGTWNEFLVALTCRYDDIPLSYSVYHVLDSGTPLAAGREVWGTPKELGTVSLSRNETNCRGTASLESGAVTRIRVSLEEQTDDHPLHRSAATNAHWKRIPSAERGAPPAVDRIVTSEFTDITVRTAFRGPSDVAFGEGAREPLARLAPTGRVDGYLFDLSWRLQSRERAVLHVFDEYDPDPPPNGQAERGA